MVDPNARRRHHGARCRRLHSACNAVLLAICMCGSILSIQLACKHIACCHAIPSPLHGVPLPPLPPHHSMPCHYRCMPSHCHHVVSITAHPLPPCLTAAALRAVRTPHVHHDIVPCAPCITTHARFAHCECTSFQHSHLVRTVSVRYRVDHTLTRACCSTVNKNAHSMCHEITVVLTLPLDLPCANQ